MIDKIKQIFINETKNELHTLKQELNQATYSELPSSVAEKVFITMHTIKGSGPMFGFNSVSEVSHSVERAYRQFSSEERPINEIILKKTKDVIALIEEVLNSKNDHLPNCEKEMQALVNFFNNINRLNAKSND